MGMGAGAMTKMSHYEACGVCHQSVCSCEEPPDVTAALGSLAKMIRRSGYTREDLDRIFEARKCRAPEEPPDELKNTDGPGVADFSDLRAIVEAAHDPAALRAENARLRARVAELEALAEAAQRIRSVELRALVAELEALVRRQRAWVDHPDVPFIYGGATAELAAIDHELDRLGLRKADE
jgi:hypothetical protein